MRFEYSQMAAVVCFFLDTIDNAEGGFMHASMPMSTIALNWRSIIV